MIQNKLQTDSNSGISAFEKFSHTLPTALCINKPLKTDAELEHKLRLAYSHLERIMKSNAYSSNKNNLSSKELVTLKSLKDKHFVFLPSDKGGEFCVIENNKYDEAAFNHLSDSSIYIKSSIKKAATVEIKN